jgi:hypothetical protein
MRDYKASMVIKMNHYIPLHHHPSLFLLPHLKQRLLRLLLLHDSSGGIMGVGRDHV